MYSIETQYYHDRTRLEARGDIMTMPSLCPKICRECWSWTSLFLSTSSQWLRPVDRVWSLPTERLGSTSVCRSRMTYRQMDKTVHPHTEHGTWTPLYLLDNIISGLVFFVNNPLLVMVILHYLSLSPLPTIMIVYSEAHPTFICPPQHPPNLVLCPVWLIKLSDFNNDSSGPFAT